MHLTVVRAATRRASTSLSAASPATASLSAELLSAAVRYECNHRAPQSSRRHRPIRSDSVFCSRVANFLEMPSAGFHYSVTSRRGSGLPAFGHVLWYPLNDGASASKSEAAVPGAATGRLLPCGDAPGADHAVRRRTPTLPIPRPHRRALSTLRMCARALSTLRMCARALSTPRMRVRGLSFLRSGARALPAPRLRTRR
jgi:hypothetical protein